MSSSSDRSAVIILTTLGATADATALARALVDERLAACVNLLSEMTSVYRWKGEVEQEAERQLVIKTTSDRIEAIQARFNELHPYELPEFVILRATASAEYLAWLQESTSPMFSGGRAATQSRRAAARRRSRR